MILTDDDVERTRAAVVEFRAMMFQARNRIDEMFKTLDLQSRLLLEDIEGEHEQEYEREKPRRKKKRPGPYD